MKPLLIAVICYLVGALPLSYGLTFLVTGRRLEKEGTGNPSVANIFRIAPLWVGICAVGFDAARVLGFLWIAERQFGFLRAELYLGFAALLLGNLYPLFLGFRGSKGRTMSIWGLLWLQPWLVLVGAVVWGILYWLLGSSRKAVFLMLPAVPLALYDLERSFSVLALSCLVGALLAVRNRPGQDDFAYGLTRQWKGR